MKTDQRKPKNIDDYIAGFPDGVQEILQKIRTTIRKAAPTAEETISYQIPTFKLGGEYLIYFAATSPTSAFIRHLERAENSRKNYQLTKVGREQCSFRWTNRFPTV